MIVADPKPLEEVWSMASGFSRVLVLGCAECVAVCRAGGAPQVASLARALRNRAMRDEVELTVQERTVRRQCDEGFLRPVHDELQSAEAVISMACGVGVNTVAEHYPATPVFPAVDTTFMGAAEGEDSWAEMCAGCGRCMLDLTGGICPVARCAKTILNGPCGGTEGGMCELSTERNPVECVWMRIIARCRRLGTLERLMDIAPPKDWSPSRHGGPRRRDCTGAEDDS